MCPTITDDEIGKSVESADGKTLGTVVDVEAATAHVDPNPVTVDAIGALLTAEREPGEAVPITDDDISEITDDVVQIDADLSADSADPDAEPTSDLEPGDHYSTTDRAGGSEPRVGGDSAAGPESAPESGKAGDVPGVDRDPVSDRPEESESITDDEYYDSLEGGARVDPDREMDESETPTTGNSGSTDDEADRNVDVDLDKETDPESEIHADEDVGDRADVHGSGSDSEGSTADDAEPTDADDQGREGGG